MNPTLRFNVQLDMFRYILDKISKFEYEDKTIISLLSNIISMGFDINFRDYQENNLISYICLLRRKELIQYVIKHPNFWPYHLDIYFNHIWGLLCKYDLEDICLWYIHEIQPLRVEDINMNNIYGENLFTLSCLCQKKEIIRECLKIKGCKIQQMNRFLYDGFMYCFVSDNMGDIIDELFLHPEFNINFQFSGNKLYIHFLDDYIEKNGNIIHLSKIWELNHIDIETWRNHIHEIKNEDIKQSLLNYEKKRARKRLSIFYDELMYDLYHPSSMIPKIEDLKGHHIE